MRTIYDYYAFLFSTIDKLILYGLSFCIAFWKKEVKTA